MIPGLEQLEAYYPLNMKDSFIGTSFSLVQFSTTTSSQCYDN